METSSPIFVCYIAMIIADFHYTPECTVLYIGTVDTLLYNGSRRSADIVIGNNE
jgi:hypothetical protein